MSILAREYLPADNLTATSVIHTLASVMNVFSLFAKIA